MTRCTHRAAQPRMQKWFALSSVLLDACRTFDQRLVELQPGPSLGSITPAYSRRKKKANKQLRNKWFKKQPNGWSRASDAQRTCCRQEGALTQLRPEPAPHQVCQYFVINKSKFSQFKARANTPCLFWVLTVRPTQAGVNKSPLAMASQQVPSPLPHQVPSPSTKLLLPTRPVTDWAGRGPG